MTPARFPHLQPVSRRTLLQAAALSSALALAPAALFAAPLSGFTHSVASGDPQQRSVTLWTRYIGPGREAAWLQAEVASDEAFSEIVSRGAVMAGPDSDFCASIRPENLEPGRWYYYRFRARSGETSPVGRTRTLPEGPLDAFRIGVFSCSNATSGWFNAYAHAAAREDLDLLVHLGDYIYESTLTRSDALEGMAAARGIEPPHETVSLVDYRLRYASYRSDPALQELHRRYPMIVLWDDHETANNSWHAGAKNHDTAEEGPWAARMAAGMRAFHEWLPMRAAPYTQYELGDLATLFRLETRQLGRSLQLDVGDWIKGHGGPPESAAIAFRDGPLADTSRSMLGPEQEQWLASGLVSSTDSGKKWQILAQQVIMGRTRMPQDFSSWFAPGSLDQEDRQKLDVAAKLATLDIPYSMDRWEGYPAARDRLFAAARAAGADLVVLSGDSHNAWALNLQYDRTPVGVEFAVQSVSSLGLDKRLSGDPAAIARSFVEASPDIQWCDTSQRGYAVLDITADRVTNEWLFVPSRGSRLVEELGAHRMHVLRDTRVLTTA